MKQKNILVYFSIILTMLFWSMSYIWIKIVYQYYNPISTVFLRLAIAAPIQFIFVKGMKKLQKIQKLDIKYLVMISVFQPFLYFLCESYSLKYVSPTTAAVIISTIPLFVPVASYFFLKERLSPLNIFGLLVSFTGILLVILKDDYSLSASPLGLVLLFMAVGAGVGYTTSVKKMTLKYTPLTIVTYQNIFGSFWFLPLFLFFDLQPFLEAKPSYRAIFSLLMLALLASASAFILFAFAIRELGASRSSAFSNTIPIFTAILSWWYLKEILNLRTIIGIIVVITGLFISQIRKLKYKRKD